MSKKNNNDKLTIFALGGVGEIGKNMYVIQYANDIVVVDAGLKFPEEDMLGIDIVIPDISYLTENRDKVRGILLTHGHEDHIGGLPYVLKHLNVPVYGTKLTLGLVENKLKEANLLGETKRILIHEDSVVQLGSTLKATFFRTNHSIPDSVGICIATPEGNVVHTGDFKFDHTPVNGQYANLQRMAAIGEEGVLALLSDSTNAEKPGFTPSEKNVGLVLEDIFRKASQRVVIATFASNVHRIQQVVNAAESTGRKITVIGRSMVNVVSIAAELGYLHMPDGMLIEPEEVNKMAADRVVVLCTGSQGEPMSALTRMARSTHRKVDILPGDTVIIAATGSRQREIRRPDDRRTLPFRGRGHLQRLELGRSRFRTRQPGRTEADAEPDETEIFPSDPRGVQNAAQACAPGGIGGSRSRQHLYHRYR